MDFEEKVIARTPKFSGRVIDLEVQTVSLPNGKTATREVVHHHGAVCLVCVTPENKLVLVKQWRAPMGQVSLEVPAGKIEVGEDPKQTAIRELNEETRFKSDKLRLVRQFYTSPGFADEKMYMFVAHDLFAVKHELPQDDDEFLQVVEYSLEECQAAIEQGLICDAKTQMAIDYWQLHQAALIHNN